MAVYGVAWLGGADPTAIRRALPQNQKRICTEPALHTYLRESRGRAPPPDDTVEFFDLDFRRLQVPRSTWELVRLPPNMCTRHCPRDCATGVAPRKTLAGGGGRAVEGRGPFGNNRQP